MTAMYRLKGLGWLASTTLAAVGFYLVSSQVAAERKRLDDVNDRIVSAGRDIRALETEFDVRSNKGQLERWTAALKQSNDVSLALDDTQPTQFVRSEDELASRAPGGELPAPLAADAPVRSAALIVPVGEDVHRRGVRQIALVDRNLLNEETGRNRLR